MKRTAAAVAATIVLLTGCSAAQDHESKRGRGDAPVAGKAGDDSPAFCTNMPDEFGNVCGKCVAHFPPWAFVVTTSTDYAPSSMSVFQAPAQCGGKVVADPPTVLVGHSGAVKPEDDDG